MTTPPLDLTTERLTALRDIAKECLGASGGDWAHEPYGGQNQNGDYAGGHVIDRYGEYLISEVADVDGAHIAAFDPPTVLALLDRVEAAGASMDRARVEVMAGEHAESCARRYAWAPDNCTCWKNAMLTALGWSNQ